MAETCMEKAFTEQEYYAQTFADLDLRGQTLEGITFDSCIFRHCDLSEATLGRCKLVDCGFHECNLANLNPGYSLLHDVTFSQCKITGVDWTRVRWSGLMVDAPVEFIRCVLSFSSFLGLRLKGLKLEECRAHEVDFRNGDFSHAQFAGTDFTHSLFGETNLNGADFSDASRYDIDIRNCRVDKAKFSHYEAVRLLEILGIEIVD